MTTTQYADDSPRKPDFTDWLLVVDGEDPGGQSWISCARCDERLFYKGTVEVRELLDELHQHIAACPGRTS